jgi:hypothetical protein
VCCDVQEYAGYVIGLMAKMCCPARDDEVQALTKLKDVVPTFKGILEVSFRCLADTLNWKHLISSSDWEDIETVILLVLTTKTILHVIKFSNFL